MRDSTALQHFLALESREKRKLIALRNRGVPFLGLRDGYYIEYADEYSEAWNFARQIYYDYTLYDYLMMGFVPNEHLVKMPFVGRMVGEVNGDLIVDCDEQNGELPPPSQLDQYSIETKRRFVVSRLGLARHEGNYISTLEIMEAAAVLNELFWLPDVSSG